MLERPAQNIFEELGIQGGQIWHSHVSIPFNSSLQWKKNSLRHLFRRNWVNKILTGGYGGYDLMRKEELICVTLNSEAPAAHLFIQRGGWSASSLLTSFQISNPIIHHHLNLSYSFPPLVHPNTLMALFIAAKLYGPWYVPWYGSQVRTSPTHLPLGVPGWRHLSSSSSLSSTTTVSSFRPKWYEWALDSNDDHPPTWIAPLQPLDFWLTSLPAAWEFSQFKMVHLEMNQESSLCQESCPWTPCVMSLGPSWTWIYLGRISCSKKYL